MFNMLVMSFPVLVRSVITMYLFRFCYFMFFEVIELVLSFGEVNFNHLNSLTLSSLNCQGANN